MLPIALLISILGFVTLVVGLRGRVAQRGVFCRKCRFDLAGIKLDTSQAICPECGRSVGKHGTTRLIRRAKRKGVLVVGITICLLGFGLATIHFTGKSASMYAVMPDRVVLMASQWGSDEALDELLVRLSSANQTQKWLWDESIRHALEFQADTTLKWDPRRGEVVSLAWRSNRLNEKQIAQFVRNGIVSEVVMRDRYRVGDQLIRGDVIFAQTRLKVLTLYRTGFMHHLSITRVGGIFQGEEWQTMAGGSARMELMLPPRAGGAGVLLGSSISVPPEIEQLMQPGDEFEVFIEFMSELKHMSDGSIIETLPTRFTHMIAVLESDDLLVDVHDDPSIVQSVRTNCTITPFFGIKQGISSTQLKPVAQSSIIFTNLLHGVAGRVYLRNHTDGELFEAGWLTQNGLTNLKPGREQRVAHAITLLINEWEEDQYEAFQRVTRDGAVDVVFKSDPDVAALNPRLTGIIDVDMEFIGVPLMWFETKGELHEAEQQAKSIPASEPDGG